MPAVATAQAERTISPEELDAYIAEFEQDPQVTPVIDGVGGISDAELADYHDLVRATQAAEAPEKELIPGQMWSDTVGIPPSVDKTQADAAEIAIATEQDTLPSIEAFDTQTMAQAPNNCKTFLFSPHQVCGAILSRYEALGGQFGWLMHPVEPMYLNPDGRGYRQMFRNGFIYWHPDTGAHAVTTRSAVVWDRHGWENGWLGYPLGGEVPVEGSTPLDGELNGWVQIFQGGRIYRSPLQQVASINGLILDKWLQLDGHAGILGFPVTDEAQTEDGVGRFSQFQFGSIYWHPSYGAHEVDGLIREVWAQNGYEQGAYGYPTSGAHVDNQGRYVQNFVNGTIDLKEEIDRRGTTEIAGKEVSNLLIAALERQGIPIGSSLPSNMAQNDAITPLWTTPTEHNGGIVDPPGYVYDPSKGSLNDYCTKSPDYYTVGTPYADFTGACAHHDDCYGSANNSADYATCNREFKDRLTFICETVYLHPLNTHDSGCKATARGYYSVVVAVHPSHWNGHINT